MNMLRSYKNHAEVLKGRCTQIFLIVLSVRMAKYFDRLTVSAIPID